MNDAAGEYLPAPENKSASQSEPDATKENAPLRPGEVDLLAGADAQLVTPGKIGRKNSAAGRAEKKPRKPLIEFYSPSQLKNYVVPADQCLVGDFHLQRGAASVLAGPPGCGKSRATLWLAILGAQGSGNWFGMPVRHRFKTMIVQSENGLARLHRDFEQIPNLAGLDDWIRISSFPGYRGFDFANKNFLEELKAAIRQFGPDLVIFDPWNDIARNSMEQDYQDGAALEIIRDAVLHQPDSRADGRQIIVRFIDWITTGKTVNQSGVMSHVLAFIYQRSSCRTQSELADKLEISQGRVSQLINQIGQMVENIGEN